MTKVMPLVCLKLERSSEPIPTIAAIPTAAAEAIAQDVEQAHGQAPVAGVAAGAEVSAAVVLIELAAALHPQ